MPKLEEIAKVAPDILAIQGFDYDHDLVALNQLKDRLVKLDHAMPFHFSAEPNSGRSTGFDLDRDGRFGEPEDAEGFGHYPGQGGMALLSRFPIDRDSARDFSRLSWSDLPDHSVPQSGAAQPYYRVEEMDMLPLHSVSAWAVPVNVHGKTLWVLSGKSSTPVFDGSEDRNGLRNADQARFWHSVIKGDAYQGWQLPQQHFAFLGGLNADPADGEGKSPAFLKFLQDHRIQDPHPRARQNVVERDPMHRGPANEDTTRWRRNPGPGDLRVDYVLPSADLVVKDAGIMRPAAGGEDDLPRHFLVWVDILWQ